MVCSFGMPTHQRAVLCKRSAQDRSMLTMESSLTAILHLGRLSCKSPEGFSTRPLSLSEAACVSFRFSVPSARSASPCRSTNHFLSPSRLLLLLHSFAAEYPQHAAELALGIKGAIFGLLATVLVDVVRYSLLAAGFVIVAIYIVASLRLYLSKRPDPITQQPRTSGVDTLAVVRIITCC